MNIRKSFIVVASFTLLTLGVSAYHLHSIDNSYVVSPYVVEAGLRDGDASSTSSSTQVL